MLDVFLQTLSIVAEGIFPTDVERDPDNLPSDLVAQFRGIYSKLPHGHVPDSVMEWLQKILDKLPPSSSHAVKEKVKMPRPEPESDAIRYPDTSRMLGMDSTWVGGIPGGGFIDGGRGA